MGIQLCMDVWIGSQNDSPAGILLLMRPTPSALNSFRVHHGIRVEAMGYRISVDLCPGPIRDMVTPHSAPCEDPRPGRTVNFTSSKSPVGPVRLGTCRHYRPPNQSSNVINWQRAWQLQIQGKFCPPSLLNDRGSRVTHFGTLICLTIYIYLRRG